MKKLLLLAMALFLIGCGSNPVGVEPETPRPDEIELEGELPSTGRITETTWGGIKGGFL